MKVGYNTVWPVTFLVLGTGLLLLSFVATTTGMFTPLVILGPLLMLFGLLQLVRPYFEYDPGTRTISVKALAGPATRRFGGVDGDQLTVADNRIVCTHPDGRTRKVPVSRTLAKREDWDAVLAKLS